jgi:hypothetical protein
MRIDSPRFRRAPALTTWLGAGLLVAASFGCDSTEFGAASPGGSKSHDDEGDDDDDDDDATTDQGSTGTSTDGDIVAGGEGQATVPILNTDGAGSAGVIFGSADGKVRREQFTFGADQVPPIVDYLFVIDNSPSMNNNVTQLQAGFRTLTADKFPAKAKVAITSTVAAEPGDLTTPINGDAQESVAAGRAEPGFIRLVSQATIQEYKASDAKPAAKAPFAAAGCANAWFSPEEVDAGGVRCFDAHTPISLKGGPCEAGIVSYRQLLQKMAGARLFRKAALVQVVFVSDTHDPGCDGGREGKLSPERRSFAELKAETEAVNVDLAGVRFHAIAPSKTCAVTESKIYRGLTYYDVATASGGKTLDICQTQDFSGILADIVATSTPTTAIFQLSKPAAAILWVKVGGAATNDYTFRSGDIVEIPSLTSDQASQVEIAYEVL